MPYVTIVIPAATGIGKPVDTTICGVPARVTLLSEQTLRIEPDDVGTIIGSYVEDSRMTVQAIVARRKSGAPA